MSESDSDARTLGLILIAWIGVSIGIMALGGLVETMLWVSVGKAIRVVGALVLFPSVFILDAFSSALPQTLRHRFYIGLAVVVSASWRWCIGIRPKIGGWCWR